MNTTATTNFTKAKLAVAGRTLFLLFKDSVTFNAFEYITESDVEMLIPFLNVNALGSAATHAGVSSEQEAEFVKWAEDLTAEDLYDYKLLTMEYSDLIA